MNRIFFSRFHYLKQNWTDITGEYTRGRRPNIITSQRNLTKSVRAPDRSVTVSIWQHASRTSAVATARQLIGGLVEASVTHPGPHAPTTRMAPATFVRATERYMNGFAMTRRHLIQVPRITSRRILLRTCFFFFLFFICFAVSRSQRRGVHQKRLAMAEKPRDEPPSDRRRPVIASGTRSSGARFRASAGETAAECAAVLCCCPCCLANLVAAAAVKLPSAIIRRVRRRRQRRKELLYLKEKKTKAAGRKVGTVRDDDDDSRGVFISTAADAASPSNPPSEEMIELEKNMIAKFYGAGFWRSPSQRER